MNRRDFVHEWLPVGLRALAVVLVAPPAVSKFLAYEMHVAQFEMWGVPMPAVSVLVAGVIELLAVVSFVLGAGGRFGALGLTSVMVVAMLTAGINPLNTLVLCSAIGIVILGTGRFSLWMPEQTLLTERK